MLSGVVACSVTVAELVFEESVLLVAVTVAVVAVGTVDGAVYTPDAEMVPIVAVHVTPWCNVESPLIVAVNAWVPPGDSVTAEGLTLTEIGVNVTVAVAAFEGSVLLVALIVALVAEIGVGAV